MESVQDPSVIFSAVRLRASHIIRFGKRLWVFPYKRRFA
jgi:hypothetical protein